MTEQLKSQALEKVIRYEVEITGHAAPYKWECYRVGLDSLDYKVASGEAHGDMNDALEQADEAAREDQWERRHRNTMVRALLFECDPEPSELARLERDAEIVNYGLAGEGRLRVVA